jgi:FkbM family methyltransferase
MKISVYDPKTDCVSQSISKGDYDTYDTNILKEFVSPGDHVFDIGAHLGFYTIILADLVGPLGRVTCFEPSIGEFRQLSKNVGINGLEERVVLHNLALSDKSEDVNLYFDPHNSGDSRLWNHHNNRVYQQSSQAVALDNFLIFYLPVSFMKIDIQGWEVKALRGMRKFLHFQKDITIHIEYWPWGIEKAGDTIWEFWDELKEFPFRCIINGTKQKLEEMGDIFELVKPGTDHFSNLLFSKKPIKL